RVNTGAKGPQFGFTLFHKAQPFPYDFTRRAIAPGLDSLVYKLLPAFPYGDVHDGLLSCKERPSHSNIERAIFVITGERRLLPHQCAGAADSLPVGVHPGCTGDMCSPRPCDGTARAARDPEKSPGGIALDQSVAGQ